VLATPAKPITNDTVTLIATVTSSVGAKGPSGAITFQNGSTPISACADLPVTPTAQTVTVTCQTSFAASTLQLTAVFAPGTDSDMTSSASATDVLTVGRAPTSTTLAVSTTAAVGENTTYTANVAQPPASSGPIGPTGSVEFFDGGQPIASCLSQPLVGRGATCTVTYRAPGTHSITAQYRGDANFTASDAIAQPINVVQLSVRQPPVSRPPGSQPPAHALSITSAIRWTFYYTPTYTMVLALVVNRASGATVLVNCHGRGCPFTKHATRVNSRTRCGAKGTRTCPTHGRIDLAPWFEKHRLSIGAEITVAIMRPGWIGKYYVFTVRTRRFPDIKVACLAPGATRPHIGSNGRPTSCG
jgi:Bacterial Ig-like domain (group 3)